MKRILCLLFIILFAFPMVACSGQDPNNPNGEKTQMKLKINDQSFEVELDVSDTTRELCKLLPLELEMNDLNKNEKYFYLDNELPTDKYSPLMIQVGDVMLYQDNCLVIFYESFESPFYYTKIGKIKNTEHLKDALGSGSIKVFWSL